MKIIDLYPLRGCFSPGAEVELELEIEFHQPANVIVEIEISNLDTDIFSDRQIYNLGSGKHKIPLTWTPPPEDQKGYGVQVKIFEAGTERLLGSASTAFDVLAHWTDFPRYGYLSDFQEDRSEPIKTLRTLVPFHINGLQFYDWQYRHDQLVPPADTFIDPLGRKLSLPVIKELIRAAHHYGMAAMPYLAVYAASINFWKTHQSWGMFDADGNAHTFEDFLGLMDPSPGAPWIQHLLDQCSQVESELDFDGFHVDQYGEPKQAFTSHDIEIDLPAAFTAFINQLKARPEKPPVVFNAVGNWPIEALADSNQDFMYIEIWPPTPSYTDIEEIVTGAREKSGGKPVVIAQYLHSDQLDNIRLSNSIIMACGGTRIELGEQVRLLVDPYFPKHEEITLELTRALRRTSDFIVRYGELLGPKAKNVSLPVVTSLEDVTVLCRETETHQIINLINMRGLSDAKWTETHTTPTALKNFQIGFQPSQKIKQILWASPDTGQMDLLPCKYHSAESSIIIDIPSLEYWTMIVIEFNNMEE